MATDVDWTMKVGDLLPILEVTCEDVNGPVDLSTAASARLLMHSKETFNIDPTTSPKIDAAVTIDPDQVTNKGKVTYDWISGDTDTKGVYFAEVEVLYGTKPLTFPNGGYYIINIVEDLDPNV